jgi:hypothetical protein
VTNSSTLDDGESAAPADAETSKIPAKPANKARPTTRLIFMG